MCQVHDVAGTSDIIDAYIGSGVHLSRVANKDYSHLILLSKLNELFNRICLRAQFLFAGFSVNTHEIVEDQTTGTVLPNGIRHRGDELIQYVVVVITIDMPTPFIGLVDLGKRRRGNLLVRIAPTRDRICDIAGAGENVVEPGLFYTVGKFAAEKPRTDVIIERIARELSKKTTLTRSGLTTHNSKRSEKEPHQLIIDGLQPGSYTVNILILGRLDIRKVGYGRNRGVFSVQDQLQHFVFAANVKDLIQVFCYPSSISNGDCWDVYDLCSPATQPGNALFLHFHAGVIVVGANDNALKLIEPFQVFVDPVEI